MPHRQIQIRAGFAAIVLSIVLVTPAMGQDQAPDPEIAPEQRAAIERLIDDWYVQQCAGEDGRLDRLMVPGGLNASPGYRYADTGSAALGPRYYVSLAATASLFRHEITRVKADARFARVQVRERGYTYAPVAMRTNEQQGRALMVLERQPDGRWQVLAHQSDRSGFPPSLATVPLPDLSPEAVPHEVSCGRYIEGEFAK